MADSHPLAGLLDRATHVLKLVGEQADAILANERSPGDETQQRAAAAWKALRPAIIETGESLPSDPNPMADWIREVGRVAQQFDEAVRHHGLAEVLFSGAGDDFMRVAEKGQILLREMKAKRNPFAFVDAPADGNPSGIDNTPRCIVCGQPLQGRDRDRSTCHDCRSPKGKLADLDIAIRASGDSPDRLSEWPAIRHVLREKFGSEHSAETLWERFTDLLQAGGITPNEYLVYPLGTASVRYLISLAERCAHATELPLERDVEGNLRAPAWAIAAHGLLLDQIELGPRPGFGNRFPISDFDALVVDGDTPSICPKTDRPISAEWLPTILGVFRRAGLVKPGQTIHWVGSQSKLEHVCTCFRDRDTASTKEARPIRAGEAFSQQSDLERLIAALEIEIDDRETSIPEEYVSPEPLRGRDLYFAVQAVERHYSGKLPMEPWQAWRGMLLRADEGKGEADPHERYERYYVFCETLSLWARAELSRIEGAYFDGAGLIDRLLAGPEDADLSPREMALLEAYLKLPVSLAQMQREAKTEGKSESVRRRNKLTLIRDFNRNLGAATSAAKEARPGTRAGHNEPAEATALIKPKRSTERGEGQAKLIAALTKHHKYADGGCLNTEPIGNNELARLAGVDQATASAFFKKQFKGHRKYKAACADAAGLAAALKLLNGEFAPHLLYGGKPADEDERDEE